jgi:hypothetical protein
MHFALQDLLHQNRCVGPLMLYATPFALAVSCKQRFDATDLYLHSVRDGLQDLQQISQRLRVGCLSIGPRLELACCARPIDGRGIKLQSNAGKTSGHAIG